MTTAGSRCPREGVVVGMMSGRGFSPRRVLLALVCALMLVVSACSGVGSSSAQSDTLTVATATAPATLSPSELSTIAGWMWVVELAYDPLLWFEPDGSYKPGLATEWGFSDRNTKFSLTLRPNVKFSDGSPLTADSVAASLNYGFKNPASRSRLYAPGYDTATATAPLQVTISCREACPALPWLLSQNVQLGSIVSPAGLADPKRLGTEMFGAGPYVLNNAESAAGDHYTFDPNPNYWNPSAIHYKRVVVRVIANESARLSALQTGQVDLIDSVPLPSAETISGDFTVDRGPSSFVAAIFHDIVGAARPGDAPTKKYSAPLANLAVRQALNYAIDRQTIARSLGHGFAKPSALTTAPGSGAYDPGLENSYPYDPDKAKALLAQAGYPDGFTLEVATNAASPDLAPWALAVVEYWQKIGVKVNLNSAKTIPIWVQAAQDYPAIIAQLGAQPFVAQMYYWYNPGTTYSQWHMDPAIAPMVHQSAEDSPEQAGALHLQIEKYAVENAFGVGVATLPGLFAHSNKINLNMTAVPDATRAGQVTNEIPIVTRITNGNGSAG